MQPASLDIDDTIVAVSTAPATPGSPALTTVVRLSGRECLAVARRCFAPAQDWPIHGFAAIDGSFRRAGQPTIPASAWQFRRPRSYTGQDMIEFHLPGSAALAESAVGALIAAGARVAEPGEFTLRAVLTGRIDLTAAEAVADLIAARSDGQLRAAMQLADGALVRQVAAVNNRLADVLAEIEAGLDFADEPIEFITADLVSASLADARTSLERLASQPTVESLDRQPTVVLVGQPNAGKSSLLNRLTGMERALCSPVAGTTRDVLSAPLSLPGGEVQLVDVAGLVAAPGERLEALAHAAAIRAASAADLVILVVDPTAPVAPQVALLDRDELRSRPAIIAVNKSDLGSSENVCSATSVLVPGGQPGSRRAGAMDATSYGRSHASDPRHACDTAAGMASGERGGVAVSALTGEGLDALKSAITDALFADAASRPAEQITLNARHRGCIVAAMAAMDRAATVLARAAGLGRSGDLVAGEIREAIDQLGRISGQVMTEDILDRVFARFCLGK